MAKGKKVPKKGGKKPAASRKMGPMGQLPPWLKPRKGGSK